MARHDRRAVCCRDDIGSIIELDVWVLFRASIFIRSHELPCTFISTLSHFEASAGFSFKGLGHSLFFPFKQPHVLLRALSNTVPHVSSDLDSSAL